MPKQKLGLPKDRELLAFIFARFIDGEFTGLKEGYALNYAPDIESADFLALQIRDEIRHARMYRTLYALCSAERGVPKSPWLLTLIMAPVTGRLWLEHCFLDKALGERWVLYLMETLIETVDDRRIVNSLKAIARDEKRHIEFGEKTTTSGIGGSGFRKFYLWGLYLRVDFSLALAFRLTRSLITRKYGPAAAAILEKFFFSSRERIAGEIQSLLGTNYRRSFWHMALCQAIFLVKLPFTGWFRHPRQTF